MRRRELIALLGGAAAMWPCAAGAQQSQRVPIIGFLGADTPAAQRQWTAAFAQRLRELGWIEGRNVGIDYRWAEGRYERSPEIMAEFVRRRVDVIVTHATPNVVAAKQATKEIPIVFAAIANPVGLGLVASLARPGGNITGLSIQASDLAGKRLELLREIHPNLRRLAILVNAENPNEIEETISAARALGCAVSTLEVRMAEDIAPVFEGFETGADALYIQSDPLLNSNRAQIDNLASAARLPTISGIRTFVDAGALMSYGPDFADLFRRAADYVDKILRGANPGNLPVEQPTKFDLVINVKTAKALGLTVPPTLLALADEVIE